MATAQDIIDLVRPLLNDSVAPVRYTDAELVRWISDAQREIIRYKPESNPVTTIFPVSTNSPYQELNIDDALALVRVEANGTTVAGAPSVSTLEDWTVGTTSTTSAAAQTLNYPNGRDVLNGHSALLQSVTVILFHTASATAQTPSFVSLVYGGVTCNVTMLQMTTGADERQHTWGIGLVRWDVEGVPANDTITLTMGAAQQSYTDISANTFDNVVSIGTPEVYDGSDATLEFTAMAHVPGGSVAIIGEWDNSKTKHAVPPAPWDSVTDRIERDLNAGLNSSHEIWQRNTTTLEANPLSTSVGSTPTPPTIFLGGMVLLSGTVLPGSQQWGDIVRRVDRHVLDSLHDAWPYNPVAPLPAQGSFFKEWSLDPHLQRAFYLHPAPDADAVQVNDVFVTYVGNPVEITATGDTLTLSDMYNYSVINYIIYRALSDQAQGFSAVGSTAALLRFGTELQLDRKTMKALLGTQARADGATK